MNKYPASNEIFTARCTGICIYTDIGEHHCYMPNGMLGAIAESLTTECIRFDKTNRLAE